MSGRLIALIGWLAAVCLALGLAAPAMAHLTPNSEVRLTIGERAVTADIIVPQGEYAYATGNPVDGSPRAAALARAYLARNIAVTGADGSAWQVAVGQPQFVQIAGPPDLHALATFTPPAGASTARFAVDWRVVVPELPSHFALFVVTGAGGTRQIAGAARTGSERVMVARREGPLQVLGAAISLGMRHIATGFDHMLFLLALLLPAPLIAAGRRWADRRSLRATMRKLLGIVTAFTAGHSLTLVGATLGGWQLPPAPVEIAIAVSVLVSAIHAIRPLFPGREPLVAGAFGLVHGLAFATLVHDADATMASSAVGLLGFNLGIEIVQLAVVAVAAPILIALSRRTNYGPVRIVLGALCAVAASVWIGQRAGDLAGPVAVQYALALGLIAVVLAWSARMIAEARRAPLARG